MWKPTEAYFKFDFIEIDMKTSKTPYTTKKK